MFENLTNPFWEIVMDMDHNGNIIAKVTLRCYPIGHIGHHEGEPIWLYACDLEDNTLAELIATYNRYTEVINSLVRQTIDSSFWKN